MTAKLELPQQPLSTTPAWIATASLFASLIPLSLAPILVKLCEQEIGSNAVAFHRGWIATIVFGLLSGLEALDRQKSDNQPVEQKPFTRRELGLLVALGTFGATSLLLWSLSLTQTNVANVTLLCGLKPVFVGLGGWLLLGRRYNSRFIIGMVMALGGAIAIGLDDAQFATDQVQGNAIALLSGICFAAYLILLELLRARFTTATLMLWRCAFTTMFALPILALSEERLFPHSWMGWFFVIFQALFCQVVGQGLLAYSLSRLSSGFVAVTLLFEPVLASILAWVIFSERLGFVDWVAFAVVLVGIYIAQSSQSAVKTMSEGVQAAT
ncbi:DMT family transporter [Argonema galeatum]|uniref:DMT family transporter n=1 Tax=Argonema galeatum TaxID=2942762 RepID=UPI002011A754|nr:DMT family transporter [Argonema galeatum]MCL1466710.1 DMT family transporter [Argonema galeatum A003/A1]